MMTGRRTLRHGLLVGGAVGALFHLFLFILSLAQYRGAEFMGMHSKEVEEMIYAMFSDTVVLLQLKILVIQLGFGVGIGFLVGAWFLLLFKVLSRESRGIRFAGWVFLGLLVVHNVLLWYAMTRYPTLFIDRFFHDNFAARWFQIIASEFFTLPMYKVLLSLWLLSFPAGIGWLLLRPSSPFVSNRSPLRFAWTAAALVPALLLLVVVWGPLPDSWRFDAGKPADRPNVLIIGVDSLRPDYMVMSRGKGFSRIAAQSVVYDNAYTILPRTFPALVTMLSGQYPHNHGIRHMFPDPPILARPFEALPRVLSERGWETGVFSDFAGDIFSRIDLGFDAVDVPEFSIRSNVRQACWKLHVHLLPYLLASGVLSGISDFECSERYADPAILTDRFLSWLSERESDRPFFGFVFYSATHYPYASPYPYYRERHVPGYMGAHRYCKIGMAGSDKGYTDEDKEQTRLNLLAGVDAVDDQVERIQNLLEESGQLDNTLIIVTADHGENVYEHNRGNSHGEMLNGRESLVVPFLFKEPGRTSAVQVEEPVSNLDLAPTILGMLGETVPDWMEGANLAANEGYRPEAGSFVFAETGLLFLDPDTDVLRERSIRYSGLFDLFQYTPDNYELFISPRFTRDTIVAKHRMLLKGKYKLIYIPTRQEPKFECYHLGDDPGEIKNLYDPAHPVCEPMKEQLLDFIVAAGDGRRIGDFVVP